MQQVSASIDMGLNLNTGVGTVNLQDMLAIPAPPFPRAPNMTQ